MMVALVLLAGLALLFAFGALLLSFGLMGRQNNHYIALQTRMDGMCKTAEEIDQRWDHVTDGIIFQTKDVLQNHNNRLVELELANGASYTEAFGYKKAEKA